MTSNEQQPIRAMPQSTELHGLRELLGKRQARAKGRVVTVLIVAALLLVAHHFISEAALDAHAAAIAQVIAET